MCFILIGGSSTNEIPGWTRGFGELRATPGCIFASGLHGVVQAFHPTNPLIPVGAKPIAEGIPQTPTAMTVDRGLLVVGAGDGTIYIWSSSANRNGITC
ncbi:unnamed protein product [Dicrocoelium dendriticum]|nr:unnamed protein product [Dicrocoelium dendriticum]